jgi:hypothetical protein
MVNYIAKHREGTSEEKGRKNAGHRMNKGEKYGEMD